MAGLTMELNFPETAALTFFAEVDKHLFLAELVPIQFNINHRPDAFSVQPCAAQLFLVIPSAQKQLTCKTIINFK